jgi:ankyrin repeat protein
VGAYRRALARSHGLLRDLVKETRKSRFEALPSDERQARSSRFMEACRADDAPAVLDLLEAGVDVEGFCLGPDGTTTCGLHSAAFHNGCDVLRALLEEGCCSADLADGNGWTALHFAAGADSVGALRLLLGEGGADDAFEAGNGYTPLQWAERLQNAGAAAVLREAAASRRRRQHRLHPHQLLLQLHRELHRRFFLLSAAAPGRDGEGRRFPRGDEAAA